MPLTLYQKCQVEFRASSQRALELIGQITDDETDYYETGLMYHWTCLEARENHPYDEVEKLRKAYEISTTEERDTFFKQWQKVLTLGHGILEKAIVCSDEDELLRRRGFVQSALQCAEELTLENQAQLQALENMANNLSVTEAIFRQHDNIPWTNRALYREEPEWYLFFNFILTVPENLRQLDAGRSIPDVLDEIMRGEPDMEIVQERGMADVWQYMQRAGTDSNNVETQGRLGHGNLEAPNRQPGNTGFQYIDLDTGFISDVQNIPSFQQARQNVIYQGDLLF